MADVALFPADMEDEARVDKAVWGTCVARHFLFEGSLLDPTVVTSDPATWPDEAGMREFYRQWLRGRLLENFIVAKTLGANYAGDF